MSERVVVGFGPQAVVSCAVRVARVWTPVILALAVMGQEAPAASRTARPLASVRTLAKSLGEGRCARAQVEYQLADPLGGPPRAVRGHVTVEAPDRVRLEFETTGERITLRGDGGEWLQPSARQMVRIPADRASAALMWWRVLLPVSRDLFREDSLAPRRFRLSPIDAGAAPMTVLVSLDARGLPARVALEGGEESAPVYRFSGWRFAAAQGVAAFRLKAPAGFSEVDLP